MPAYLPELAQTAVPWARQYVGRLERRSGADLSDLWDAALAALIRASLGYDPTRGPKFLSYASRAVKLGCLRYCGTHLAGPRRHERMLPRWQAAAPTGLEQTDAASPEALLIAYEELAMRAVLD